MSRNIRPYYVCDYKRVKDCPKTECQINCFQTLIKERARLDEEGNPIIVGYMQSVNKRKDSLDAGQ